MKKAEDIRQLHAGQKIFVGDDVSKKQLIIRSVEDKLVPYVIASDNSSHSIRKGIWIEE
ncbi:MAG: hypothetical protein IKS54_07845 [Erysipelotrichaceae bacterium]|nr:hypothetical protein [Erysipelotrichaceae bacterium]